jgi:hypothetical protein
MKKYILMFGLTLVMGLFISNSFAQTWSDIGSNNISNDNTGNVVIGDHLLGGGLNKLTVKNAGPANALLNSFYTGTPGATPQTLGAFRILNSGVGEPAHQFFMGLRKDNTNNFDLVQSVFVEGYGWSEFSAFTMVDRVYEIRSGVTNTLFNNSGAVGIGVDKADIAKLAGVKLGVNGKIVSTEVEVKLYGSWPDFVFQDDFNLMPLNELESFISTNKHLPGVPTEAEVTESGVNLGEMTGILLQKVEEMTLHIIELNKRIEELEK